MSLHTARLSKILKIAYADERLSRKNIFDDVSEYIRKEKNPEKASSSGGDFHGVLWAAFKDCIFEYDPDHFDQIVEALIDANLGRKRLFPPLAQGLKSWGLKKQRWMNEEIKRIKSPTGAISVDGLDVAIKVNNILALEIVGKGNRYIYPYFSEEPAVTKEAARVALWQLHQTLPDLDINELRILDVMRGKSYSVEDVSFVGDEQALFELHINNIMHRWEQRYQQRNE